MMRLRVLSTAGLLCAVFVTRGLASECDPNDPRLLKPDLVAQTPTKVRVVQRGGHRQLIFTTTIANVGDGPLIVHGGTVGTSDGSATQATQEILLTNGGSCTRVAGLFEFHPSHDHFHIDDFANYLLRKDDPFSGPIVAQSTKVSFCLLDVVRLHGFRGTHEVLGDCNSPDGTQGISVGFADVYDSLLPGQMIDLDADPANPVPAGNYFLVNVPDPDGLLWKKSSDPQASAGVVSVAVPAGRGSHAPGRPVHPSRPGANPPTAKPTPTGTPMAMPTPTPTPRSVNPPSRHPVRQPHQPNTGRQPGHPIHVLPPGHEGCGGIAGKLCSAGEFCEFLAGACNIQNLTGLCVPMNQNCSSTAQPVCGCNGVTYTNDCQRRRAGVSAAHAGPC